MVYLVPMIKYQSDAMFCWLQRADGSKVGYHRHEYPAGGVKKKLGVRTVALPRVQLRKRWQHK